MEFKEMKKIWDSQNEESIYAIDEQTLHQKLVKKNLKINRFTSLFQGVIFMDVILAALAFAVVGVLLNDGVYLLESSFLILMATYIFRDWRKGIKYRGPSDGSILSDLKRAILTVEYQVKRQRNFIWWYILPGAAIITVHGLYTDHFPWWLILVSLAVLGLIYWATIKVTNKSILPLKKDLESLKALLESGVNMGKN